MTGRKPRPAPIIEDVILPVRVRLTYTPGARADALMYLARNVPHLDGSSHGDVTITAKVVGVGAPRRASR